MAIGINPTVGVTTVLVILLAWAFGLNQLASQIGVHVVAPLHLLLFVPFMQLGVYLFHSRHLPFSSHEIKHMSHHPVKMVHSMWQWEWHGLVVWAVVASVLMPVVATFLRRALVLMLRKHRTLIQSKPVTE